MVERWRKAAGVEENTELTSAKASGQTSGSVGEDA
jgi:hypothetical protein